MRYRNFKHTGLKVSAIGFGTWPISGHGMGSADKEQAAETIRHAWELGINFFDTADMYGFGYAEELLSESLGEKRREAVITTKVGLEWDEKGNLKKNLKPDYVIRACENSLRRLRLDTIDLYQLHWPDPNTPIEETMGALQKLVNDGKVRHIGVSNFSVDQIEEARKHMPIVANQIEYSMLERSPEKDIIPYCGRNEIGIMAYKVLGRGLLTGRYTERPVFEEGDWRKDDPEFQEERFAEILGMVNRLRPIAESYGITLSQLATAWVLRLPEIPSVIVGAKQPKQLEESCQGAMVDWQEHDLAAIERILGSLRS